MTIYLAHPAGFAYDLLAIAAVKAARNPDNAEAKENLLLLDEAIQAQVGTLLHEQVCASPEYAALLEVNDAIYVRNDLIKTRPPTGDDMAYTDGKVGERWRAKAALQAKWFPGTRFTEQKFGYDKGAA